MLRFLHEYCPETLWAYVDPDLAQDLHTVHFVHPVAPATQRTAPAGAAA